MSTRTKYRARRRTLMQEPAGDKDVAGAGVISSKDSPNDSSTVSSRASFGILSKKLRDRGYNISHRKISPKSRAFFSDGVLQWQTGRGVRRLRFSAAGQRSIFGGFCAVSLLLVGFVAFLFYQNRQIVIETRRLTDSAALLREAHSALLDDGGHLLRDNNAGGRNSGEQSIDKSVNSVNFDLSSLSRSQKMLSLLEPDLQDKSARAADIRLLRDRASIEMELRRARRALREARHNNGTLTLETATLQKKYERLQRALQSRRQDLQFQRTALSEAEKRTRGAEDRLLRIETSALSLLKDLRDVLGTQASISHDVVSDPMLAIRNLANTFANEANDRRLKLTAYSEYLDYAISGLERTVFSMGIQPSFLEMLGYDISPISAPSSKSTIASAVSSSVDGSADLVSIGIGGPLSDEDSQEDSVKLSYTQSFSDLDSKFQRFNALRSLVGCMPLEHPLRGGGRFVSGYGRRLDPFTKEPAMHYGIDFGAWYDTDVYPGGKGRVTFTGYKSSYGRVIEVSHGCGFRTTYAHLSAINVKMGDEVDSNSVLGKVGNTGRSTGPHLHYEVRLRNNPFNPKPFINGVKSVF